MGSYTTVDLPLAKKILALYDLGKVTNLKALSSGISNSNYRVQIGNKYYLLKVSNDKNQSQLNQEMNILNALSDKNFDYSLKPIILKNQKYTYQLDQYFGVLFPFLEGIPPGANDQTCFEIGQGLARLHNIQWNEDELNNIREYSQVGDNLDSISQFVENFTCPLDFKSSYNDLLKPNLAKWNLADKRTSLIHGDLYYDNTLFDQNKLSAILDFEQSGHGHTLLDLGISISGTCLHKGRIIRPLIDSYLKGYNRERKFTDEENELLDLAIIIGLFSISLWRIKRFTIGTLDPSMRDSYKNLIYKAKIFHDLNGH
ncbi:MAG: phosphotransferase [Bacteriovoracaceae bacterium]|nr:phosphotransferase [Bacteriovoracaceae bacterium]